MKPLLSALLLMTTAGGALAAADRERVPPVSWWIAHPYDLATAQAVCRDRDPQMRSYKCAVVSSASYRRSAATMFREQARSR